MRASVGLALGKIRRDTLHKSPGSGASRVSSQKLCSLVTMAMNLGGITETSSNATYEFHLLGKESSAVVKSCRLEQWNRKLMLK